MRAVGCLIVLVLAAGVGLLIYRNALGRDESQRTAAPSAD